MDSLLAGTLIPLERVHCAGAMSSPAQPVEILPGHRESHSGVERKLFAFPPESLFAFSPESCSSSPRYRFRVHPGIPFALPRNPQRAHEDQALSGIRRYALGYTKSLRDYTCIHVTDQKNPGATVAEDHRLPVGQAQGGFRPGRVVYEDQITFSGQRVNYKLLKIDAQYWSDRLRRGTVEANMGSPDAPPVSVFGSAIERIFDPATETHFQWVRFDELRGRRVNVFSFEVPRARGANVYDGTVQHDMVVGYKGLVFADVTSNAVVRTEVHSSDFPGDAESMRRAAFSGIALTFDFTAVRFGGQEFSCRYAFTGNTTSICRQTQDCAEPPPQVCWLSRKISGTMAASRPNSSSLSIKRRSLPRPRSVRLSPSTQSFRLGSNRAATAPPARRG